MLCLKKNYTRVLFLTALISGIIGICFSAPSKKTSKQPDLYELATLLEKNKLKDVFRILNDKHLDWSHINDPIPAFVPKHLKQFRSIKTDTTSKVQAQHTLLQVATRSGHDCVIQELLKKGAQADSTITNAFRHGLHSQDYDIVLSTCLSVDANTLKFGINSLLLTKTKKAEACLILMSKKDARINSSLIFQSLDPENPENIIDVTLASLATHYRYTDFLRCLNPNATDVVPTTALEKNIATNHAEEIELAASTTSTEHEIPSSANKQKNSTSIKKEKSSKKTGSTKKQHKPGLLKKAQNFASMLKDVVTGDTTSLRQETSRLAAKFAIKPSQSYLEKRTSPCITQNDETDLSIKSFAQRFALLGTSALDRPRRNSYVIYKPVTTQEMLIAQQLEQEKNDRAQSHSQSDVKSDTHNIILSSFFYGQMPYTITLLNLQNTQICKKNKNDYESLASIPEHMSYQETLEQRLAVPTLFINSTAQDSVHIEINKESGVPELTLSTCYDFKWLRTTGIGNKLDLFHLFDNRVDQYVRKLGFGKKIIPQELGASCSSHNPNRFTIWVPGIIAYTDPNNNPVEYVGFFEYGFGYDGANNIDICLHRFFRRLTAKNVPKDLKKALSQYIKKQVSVNFES